ncbi:MAG: helix-turn-helix domain-containing protein [Clostridia bacterium]|nr:helix-turn-helix domain-containing protein [Clostridia bacterium]
MRAIKIDDRAFNRMQAQGKSYESLSLALKARGINIKASTMYRYITHKETPNKSVKKEIARALNCAVEEIF